MTETGAAYSVIEPTRQAFLRDLKSGAYLPGERLPGERELARRYGIGRSSMVKVLHRLEKERYVERIPVYGTFIRQDVSSRVEPVKLAVASLNKPSASGIEDPFSWEASSEMIRGMISESAAQKSVFLSWYCCQEQSNPADFRRQIEDLCEFDGVIFSGPAMVEHKEALLRNGIPAMVLAPKLRYRREIFPVIDYDRWKIFPDYCKTLAEKFSERPVILVSRPAALQDAADHRQFEACFTDGFAQLGIAVEKVDIAEQYLRDFHRLFEAVSTCRNQLRLNDAPLLIAMNRVLLPPLCILIRETGSRAALAGLIGGNMTGQLHAGIPRWREPFFEMGRLAVSMMTDHLRSDGMLEDRILPMMYHDN